MQDVEETTNQPISEYHDGEYVYNDAMNANNNIQ